jgi:uncharacterized protein YecE (DUF72 family)
LYEAFPHFVHMATGLGCLTAMVSPHARSLLLEHFLSLPFELPPDPRLGKWPGAHDLPRNFVKSKNGEVVSVVCERRYELNLLDRKLGWLRRQTLLGWHGRESSTVPRVVECRAMAELHIGTSAFTAAGWEGSFYPAGMKPADFLTFYATKFDSVEVDSTFCRTPSASTVTGWNRKTPDHFVFAVKVPQQITHEKVLVDCDAEFTEFVHVMELLGEKLGPMLLQFPYFNRSAFTSGAQFLARLKPFLKKLPKGQKFAVEIRNKSWLSAAFADLLRENSVALALQDQSWMPMPWDYGFDPITSDFTFVRWLGDRKGIEKLTKTWDKTIVDRAQQLKTWVDYLQPIKKRGVTIFAYANNHYAGHGPATVAQFLEMWNATNYSIAIQV